MTKIFKNDFQPVSTLQKENNTAITDEEIANMLAFQFEKVRNIDTINNFNEQNERICKVQNFLNKNNIKGEWFKYITSPTEIKNEIRKLPSRKTPGIDKIQNIELKNLCKTLLFK